MKRRTALKISAIAAGAVIVQVSTTSPAGAHGVSAYWGDDEDTLGAGYVTQGNVVGAWQHLLHSADLGSGSNVDGLFGPATGQGITWWDAGKNKFTGAQRTTSPNALVEGGAGGTWAAGMRELQWGGSFVQDGWALDIKDYVGVVSARTGALMPTTTFGRNWANSAWKWRGRCADGGQRWIPMDHGTITFRRTC